MPGTTDIGNHGDDTVTTIALPFPFTLYGQTFTSINLSSNGNAQFMTTDTTFTNQCLPWTTHNYTVYPYWDDLYLVNSGFGIFTSISGTAPNRIFNIEWRAQYFPGSGNANFELRLYEGQTRFDVIYGTVSNGNTSATAGVQRDDACFNQYFCNGSGGPPTGGWALVPSGTPSPTPTASTSPNPSSYLQRQRLHQQQPLRLHLQLLTHLHRRQQLQRRLLQQRRYANSTRQLLPTATATATATNASAESNVYAYAYFHSDSEALPSAKKYPSTKASTDSSASAVMGDGELVERVVLNALFGDKRCR